MFTTFGLHERAKAELSRNFEHGEEASAQRVRLVALGEVELLRSDAVDQAFTAAWKQLLAEEPIACALSGEHFPAILRPRAIILDISYGKLSGDVRALSGGDVKITTFFPVQLCALWRMFGPEHLGGRGNLEEATRTGRAFEEVRVELWCRLSNEVNHVPGLPPIYDHELFPQESFKPSALEAELFTHWYECIVVLTTESYEREAVAALRKWYSAMNKSAYIVGLPLAHGSHASSGEKIQSKEADQIETFLDNALKTSGEKSLLYISFGSLYWPMNDDSEKLWAFLDVVMERNLHFIMTHASPFAHVPDAVKEKVQTYGKGILSPWAPQQLILGHPVTDWFVAHGGQNSVQELIAAGVPQCIMWPFGVDQPCNAIHLTDNLDVAYELMEVRSGLGLKPVYRNGKAPVGTIDALKEEARDTLSKAFGEDGAQKRAKLLELRQAILAEHEDGGHAKRDLEALANSF
ncbi:UDP-Glycosyltransferase/glycogen phosphorylase [Lentinus brumalis]|uniref:UDP-Glycosyltransferase/glycogen phosphorylase n=1 Tax=Lentinus brumalis TaxID=2498619 RepID=A0A371DC53_9APHY|nr:UDP-Glycosyltransferase/glycogen phosphorylase [Polyporus brumalis]